MILKSYKNNSDEILLNTGFSIITKPNEPSNSFGYINYCDFAKNFTVKLTDVKTSVIIANESKNVRIMR